MLLLVFVIVILQIKFGLGAAVIKSLSIAKGESESFSPYFAAFSEENKAEIAEYERLKRSLMYFKAIDWNVVVQPKITDSEYSSS